MDWHKTTAYPDYINLFWAIVRTEPAHRDPGTIATLAKSLGESLKILDTHLARIIHEPLCEFRGRGGSDGFHGE